MMLEFRRVGYTYSAHQPPSILNLSFSVLPGEFVGILGANDSGKTTIAKLCNGLLRPSTGEVFVDGRHIGREINLQEVRRMIGVVFSDPENQIVGTTVEEDIAFGLGNLCVPSEEMRRRIDAVLERVGLQYRAQQEPHRLSGGEQQKLCLASVLAMHPSCLILDDPLTFLDTTSRTEVLAMLQTLHAEGTTLLYCTSDPEELIQADRIFVLREGKLLANVSPAELWEDVTLLEQAAIQPSNLMLLEQVLQKNDT